MTFQYTIPEYHTPKILFSNCDDASLLPDLQALYFIILTDGEEDVPFDGPLHGNGINKIQGKITLYSLIDPV